MFIVRVLLLLLLSAPAAAVAAPYFVQCYDFGCKTTQELHFEPPTGPRYAQSSITELSIKNPSGRRYGAPSR